MPLRATPPTVQTPVALLNVPWLALALTKVKPAGNGSLTATPLAADGPAFANVNVKVTTSPTFGAALLTVFVSDRSICWPPTLALAWSSSVGTLLFGVESTSNSLAAVT